MAQKKKIQIIKVEDGVVFRRSGLLRGLLKFLGAVILFAGITIMYKGAQIETFMTGILTVIWGGIVSYGGGCLYICIQFSEFGHLWIKEKSEGVPLPRYTSSPNQY